MARITVTGERAKAVCQNRPQCCSCTKHCDHATDHHVIRPHTVHMLLTRVTSDHTQCRLLTTVSSDHTQHRLLTTVSSDYTQHRLLTTVSSNHTQCRLLTTVYQTTHSAGYWPPCIRPHTAQATDHCDIKPHTVQATDHRVIRPHTAQATDHRVIKPHTVHTLLTRVTSDHTQCTLPTTVSSDHTQHTLLTTMSSDHTQCTLLTCVSASSATKQRALSVGRLTSLIIDNALSNDSALFYSTTHQCHIINQAASTRILLYQSHNSDNKILTENKKLSYRRDSAHLTLLHRTVQKAFRYVELLRHGVRTSVTDIDGQTDEQMGRQTKAI